MPSLRYHHQTRAQTIFGKEALENLLKPHSYYECVSQAISNLMMGDHLKPTFENAHVGDRHLLKQYRSSHFKGYTKIICTNLGDNFLQSLT